MLEFVAIGHERHLLEMGFQHTDEENAMSGICG
jgi:hypothetical protein